MFVCSTTKKPKPINNKIMVLAKTDDLYSCGVQNKIRKRLLKIDNVQIPPSPTKNILSFVLKNTRFVL